jgi:hypothetical protein
MSELQRALTTVRLPLAYIELLESQGCTLYTLEQLWYDAEYAQPPINGGPVGWSAGHRAVFDRVRDIPAARTVYPWYVANVISRNCSTRVNEN